MVRPGAQIRKPRVKFLLVGRRTALIVCQAMSMAMTVVLPAPVASFRARRISSGLASLLALPDGREALAVLGLRRDLGQPDRGLRGLDLAEERTHAAELVVAPVLQQAGRLGRDLPLAGIGQAAPGIDGLRT
jgi:hypothetical protein